MVIILGIEGLTVLLISLIFIFDTIGKILLPATGYLFIVWEVFAKMHGFDELKTPFVCENIKFMRPTILSMDFETNLIVSVQKGMQSCGINSI